MTQCYYVSLLLLVCVVCVCVALLEHKYRRSNPEDIANFVQDPCEQWLQWRAAGSKWHVRVVVVCVVIIVGSALWLSRAACARNEQVYQTH